jgi:hypothetical protein
MARDMTQTRRLAAIIAADVAGYSRLIGADEEGTLNRLRSIRAEVIDPKTKSIAPLRSFVAEPMRYGHLLLAGDAAHTCSNAQAGFVATPRLQTSPRAHSMSLQVSFRSKASYRQQPQLGCSLRSS